MGKKAWKSRTLWVNVVFLLAMVGSRYGTPISIEDQTILLAIINIGLRVVTGESLEW